MNPSNPSLMGVPEPVMNPSNPSSMGAPEPVTNPSNPSSMGVPEPVMNPSAGMEEVREKAWMMEGNGITKGSNGSFRGRWNTNQVAVYRRSGWSQSELITNCEEFTQASRNFLSENPAEITG